MNTSIKPRAKRISMSKSKQNAKMGRVLNKIGFQSTQKIVDTLQGSIIRGTYPERATRANKTNTAVIKVANKSLHKRSLGIVDGIKCKVLENILTEQSILKYLSKQKNCPKSITRFRRFVESGSHYYLVMEDGGISLFSFIKKAHSLIKLGKIEISHWQTVVKVILRQMIECLEFIHSLNVTHNDISLENFLINDVEVLYPHSNNAAPMRFVTSNIQIKLCDFGLAQKFINSECQSDRYAGKKQYKSPEIIGKKERYNAKKNDIWCLGVSLFMMTVGCPPWAVAGASDDNFNYFMSGYMLQILRSWNVLHYLDSRLIDVFDSVFKYEEDRTSLQKIKEYVYGSNV